jgi:TP901 family phage tail tape measure protein
MKMANAAGASAETISDQLTAVWNNFYDGSQSLEHFADAMVRLGADTASSSDEIATGLEKFASIGQVIGLGFDEAAAALATVTAQTRQSSEVVGTAFKTIFARIQGLNLGETLEDGTTLNKYSEALAKVGISIKNEYGGIKDMNTLLDEMGEKWNLISKDQQIALAQAVGGVRQYNQIVALMDNYDFYQ